MPKNTALARRPRILLAGALLTTALLLAAFVLLGGEDDDPAATATADGPAEVPAAEPPRGPDLARRQENDAFAIGRVDAPVVMIEYSDFQCPFCGRFARETKPQLIEDYVSEGLLRIEWRHFPIFGEESEAAARASYAAGQQGIFWDFHDTAYAKTRERNSGEFAPERLVELAREAGVPDLPRFEEDLGSEATHDAIQLDQEEGYQLGVSSTPAFLINGQPVLGAQPSETFTALIEDAVARAAR